MDAEQESEDFNRVVVFLHRGCTALLRAIVEEQAENSCAHVAPELRVETFLYDKRAALFPVGSRRNPQKFNFEKVLYPGPRSSTDIDKWDLQLLAFVVQGTCGSPTLNMDLSEMRKIRNTVCHTSDGLLSNDEYQVHMQKLRIIFKRTLRNLKKPETISGLNLLFDSLEFKANETIFNESVSNLRAWYAYDKSLIEAKLDRLEEGQQRIHEKLDRNFCLLKDFYVSVKGKDPADEIQIPEPEVVIGVKNCSSEVENKVSKVLVRLLDSKLRNDPVLRKELSDECFERVSTATQEVLASLSEQGYQVSDVSHGCVILRLHCSSYEQLKSLFESAMTGALTETFRPVESAIQLQFPGVALDGYLPVSEWWRCVEELVDTLPDRDMFVSGPLHRDDLSFIKDVYPVISISDKPERTQVRMKLAPNSKAHGIRIYEKCRNGEVDLKLKTVADSLKTFYNTKDLEIKVVSVNTGTELGLGIKRQIKEEDEEVDAKKEKQIAGHKRGETSTSGSTQDIGSDPFKPDAGGQIKLGTRTFTWSFRGVLKGFEWKYLGRCVDSKTGKASTVIKQSRSGAIEYSIRNLIEQLKSDGNWEDEDTSFVTQRCGELVAHWEHPGVQGWCISP